jgi:hypothetical protein
LNGEVLREDTAGLDSKEDSVSTPLKLEIPANLTPVYFVRLELRQGGELLSSNLYWRSANGEDYSALKALPKVKLETSTLARQEGGVWILETRLRNPERVPAVMVRLTAVREKSGDRILPALYSDNYITLMPGESASIRTELLEADCRGERPEVRVSGFNAFVIP